MSCEGQNHFQLRTTTWIKHLWFFPPFPIEHAKFLAKFINMDTLISMHSSLPMDYQWCAKAFRADCSWVYSRYGLRRREKETRFLFLLQPMIMLGFYFTLFQSFMYFWPLQCIFGSHFNLVSIDTGIVIRKWTWDLWPPIVSRGITKIISSERTKSCCIFVSS